LEERQNIREEVYNGIGTKEEEGGGENEEKKV
jgi:hypothetical protein